MAQVAQAKILYHLKKWHKLGASGTSSMGLYHLPAGQKPGERKGFASQVAQVAQEFKEKTQNYKTRAKTQKTRRKREKVRTRTGAGAHA